MKATPEKNANVPMHMTEYVSDHLSSDEQQGLLEVLRIYRTGYLPLVAPITLIRHYVWKYNPSYFRDLVCLNPHAVELQSRNYV